MTKKVLSTNKEWEKKLTAEQFQVIREKRTEPAFTGKYWNNKERGMYKCAICGAELFSSDTKFASGTGWPSFTQPKDLENIELRPDTSHGMNRTEVLCKKCGAHLGHVFDDLSRQSFGKAGGPKDRGGKRYCINSVCLEFEKK